MSGIAGCVEMGWGGEEGGVDLLHNFNFFLHSLPLTWW